MKTIKQMIEDNLKFKRYISTSCPIGYWIHQVVDTIGCYIFLIVLICGLFAIYLKLLDSQSFMDYLLSLL